MKILVLLLLALTFAVGAEPLPKFKFNQSKFSNISNWIPIVSITHASYMSDEMNQLIIRKDEFYLLNLGIKYKFNDISFISFKTEYTTNIFLDKRLFSLQNGLILKNHPVLIFQFQFLY